MIWLYERIYLNTLFDAHKYGEEHRRAMLKTKVTDALVSPLQHYHATASMLPLSTKAHLLVIIMLLKISHFINVYSLKCRNGTILSFTDVDTMDNYCMVYINFNVSCPNEPAKYGSWSTVQNINGKCGVWHRRNTERPYETMISSCFCNTDNCNTPTFAQDRISAALKDESESAWAMSDLEDLIVEHSEIRTEALNCLRKSLEKRHFQNISADGGPPSTVPRKISLGTWALVGAVVVLLILCVLFFVATRRGRKIQNDLKSSRPSIVELEFSDKDSAYNERKLIDKLKTLEEKSDSAESEKEPSRNSE